MPALLSTFPALWTMSAASSKCYSVSWAITLRIRVTCACVFILFSSKPLPETPPHVTGSQAKGSSHKDVVYLTEGAQDVTRQKVEVNKNKVTNKRSEKGKQSSWILSNRKRVCWTPWHDIIRCLFSFTLLFVKSVFLSLHLLDFLSAARLCWTGLPSLSYESFQQIWFTAYAPLFFSFLVFCLLGSTFISAALIV